MWLLDTNVLSEMKKLQTGKIDPNVSKWSGTIDFHDAHLATISLYELERGVLLLERRDESQARLLRIWLSDFVLRTFAGRMLPLSEAIAVKCAGMNIPDRRPMIDSIIAATALG